MSKDMTSIGIEQESKQKLNTLKKKHRYSNVSDLVYDMANFFESNEVSPRSLKEPVAKKISAFRESLFKKLGAYERDYFKAHYTDFNMVSGYLKNELDTIKEMINDVGSKSPISIEKKIEVLEEKKEEKHPPLDQEKLEEEKAKRMEGLQYVLDDFEKKIKSRRDKIEVSKSAFLELRMSLENIISR